MINRVTLIGNVGQDAEVKEYSNRKVANFSLATNETFTKDGEKVTNTEWHRVIVWDKLAEFVEKYVTKGQLLYIEGKIKYGKYENKDGQTVYTTDIAANRVQFVGKKEEPQSREYTPPTTDTEKTQETNPADDSDLPF